MESVLMTRLERFVDLTDAERELIAEMERDEQAAPRRHKVIEIGEEARRLHVLKYGWALVYGREIEGRRAILRIYLPGEIIGMAEIANPIAVHSVEMRTSGAIAAFPREAVARMFERTPRLAALLTSLNSLDQIHLRDSLGAATRMTAEHRLMDFLLRLDERLKVAPSDPRDRFHLPLTQAEIGDCLGLTSIYISKLFRKLNEDGWLSVSERHVTFHNREALARHIGFKSVHDVVDTSWYPQP
ncbi:MAG: Crp/Fnr family transcriptional regulator [Pseudomonadota bacterium]